MSDEPIDVEGRDVTAELAWEPIETFTDFDEAKLLGDDQGQMVCATQHAGRWVYFLMPADSPDTSVRDAAFAIKEGRDLGPGERRMITLAEAARPGFLEVNDERDDRAGEADAAGGGEDPDAAVGVPGPVE